MFVHCLPEGTVIPCDDEDEEPNRPPATDRDLSRPHSSSWRRDTREDDDFEETDPWVKYGNLTRGRPSATESMHVVLNEAAIPGREYLIVNQVEVNELGQEVKALMKHFRESSCSTSTRRVP
eukprot:1919406-Heterocapsa_arctica.AAC.1